MINDLFLKSKTLWTQFEIMNSENSVCLIESTDSLKVFNSSDVKLFDTSLNEKNADIQNDHLKQNKFDLNQSPESDIGSKDKNFKNGKIKFKNVIQFKKDVVIKKLLKTIDVMNQELSKNLVAKNTCFLF